MTEERSSEAAPSLGAVGDAQRATSTTLGPSLHTRDVSLANEMTRGCSRRASAESDPLRLEKEPHVERVLHNGIAYKNGNFRTAASTVAFSPPHSLLLNIPLSPASRGANLFFPPFYPPS